MTAKRCLFDNKPVSFEGLKKGESCIFFTLDEPEAIEQRLSDEGIDVDSYKQKNSLHIHRINSSYANKLDALSSLKRIREEATRGMRAPYRFVGRTIRDTGTIEGMNFGVGRGKNRPQTF